ncbi:MAG: glycosyltransferase family 4 protein [Muribaculaceae bacterium]|nr:glycosyltransferase family 4 protein [Muribaculaceae bacterium]
MKPILVDALHINMGGGLMILNHLITNLLIRGVDFVLLKDERCPELEKEQDIRNMVILSAGNSIRKRYYTEHKNDYRAVLCFGNIPPQIKLSVPVHTYLHNVSLLKIPSDYSFKAKLITFLKKKYLQLMAKNTDTWIVQTDNTARLVKDNLALRKQPVFEYPFYNIPDNINKIPHDLRSDYCFVGDYTNAKGHEYLVDAWVKLSKSGIKPRLHLTVSQPVFLDYIKAAQNEGANIVNHGFVPFSEVIDIYNQSKAVIYPSLNESLGLGIIEAVEAGCDVIGADLPYMHSVLIHIAAPPGQHERA